MPSAAFPLVPGARLGKFEILSELASGGMGRVYVARDALTNAQVALKVLLPVVHAEPGRVERFKRESLICQQLNHANIVRIYDIGTDQGFYFLSMELLHGRDLRAWLDEEPRPELARVCALGVQMLTGLASAHAHGVVHRDFKPQNVFVTSTGAVKLLDFGVAQALAIDSHTTPGAMVGTPGYISPEQAQGRPDVDARADLYSWGVVIYEMLAGRLPFRGDSPVGVAVAHAYEAPPPIRELRPELPEALAAVVMRCLEKSPSARFESAIELREAFLAAMRDAHVPVDSILAAIANSRTPAPQRIEPESPGGHGHHVPMAPASDPPAVDGAASPPPRRRWRLFSALLGLGVASGTLGWLASRATTMPEACEVGFQRLSVDEWLGAQSAFSAVGTRGIEQACRLQTEAGVLLARGAVGEARERVVRALALEPKLVYARILEGDVAVIAGDAEAAERHYREAANARVGSAAQRALALTRLAKLALTRGDLTAAERHLAQATPAGEGLPELHRLRAQLGAARDDDASAEREYRSILSINPGDASAAALLERLERADATRADVERQRQIDARVSELARRYRERRGRGAPAVPVASAAERTRSVWLMPVERTLAADTRTGFADALGASLEQSVARVPNTRLVDREMLDRLLAELALGSSALAEPKAALELGRLVSARYLLRTRLTRLDGVLMLNLRVTDVETTEVVLSESIVVPPEAKPDEIANHVAASFDRQVGTARPTDDG
ncbi:MAG: protein kinase [bacterium]